MTVSVRGGRGGGAGGRLTAKLSRQSYKASFLSSMSQSVALYYAQGRLMFFHVKHKSISRLAFD